MSKKKKIILFFSLLLFLVVLLSGCEQKPQYLKNKKLKIYILTDLEGASGVVTFQNHSYSTGKYYEQSNEDFIHEGIKLCS